MCGTSWSYRIKRECSHRADFATLYLCRERYKNIWAVDLGISKKICDGEKKMFNERMGDRCKFYEVNGAGGKMSQWLKWLRHHH